MSDQQASGMLSNNNGGNNDDDDDDDDVPFSPSGPAGFCTQDSVMPATTPEFASRGPEFASRGPEFTMPSSSLSRFPNSDRVNAAAG
eukprot:1194991-Prorocentrum_minimum.AAC.1